MKRAKQTAGMAAQILGPCIKTLQKYDKATINVEMPQIKFGSFLSGESWRHDVIENTLKTLNSERELAILYQNAEQNFKKWKESAEPPLHEVQVLNKDWGVATLDSTKQFGEIYTVLNHANGIYPGGMM